MKWHNMIKADDGTANFFLVTILEIPKRYLNHIDYEKKEFDKWMLDLIKRNGTTNY